MAKPLLESLVKDILDKWAPYDVPGAVKMYGVSRNTGKSTYTNDIVEVVKDGRSLYVITASKSVYKLGKPGFVGMTTLADIQKFIKRMSKR